MILLESILNGLEVPRFFVCGQGHPNIKPNLLCHWVSSQSLVSWRFENYKVALFFLLQGHCSIYFVAYIYNYFSA
jgi:hypothetical protein